MLPNRPGSIPFPIAFVVALISLGGFGSLGCSSFAPERPSVTPAEEARHRVEVLRKQGRTLTPEQVRLVERLPFRSSGRTDIPRVLREGIPEPTSTSGERRSLLEMYRVQEERGWSPGAAASQTREDTESDPQR